MSLRDVREVVVASPDVAESARFHRAAFDLEVLGTDDGSALLGVPGSTGGRLRLVPAADRPAGWTPPALWDPGARLLGIYSRDLSATVSAIADAGGRPRTPVTYPYGAASLSELVAQGADGIWWTVPQAVAGAHRPSPAFAADASRLHSELHTVVLVVDDHDAAVRFFVAGGLRVAFDGTMTGPDFEELVGMPAGAALRLAFLVGPDEAPARVEIMSFTGVTAADRGDDPVGIRRIVFVADDPAADRAVLIAAGAQELDGGLLRGPAGVEIALVAREQR
ncbi:hypothetical protein [Melissospora conviva]|uniref:hypothetical protein n=1 Tax=Melissospora conviva TaxID=3388432 RepID=UPI003C19456D